MWVWLKHKLMPKGDDTNTDSKFLYAQPKADTWMGKYSGPRYNEVLGLANDFLYPVIGKYMEKNLDITKAPQSEQILPVP